MPNVTGDVASGEADFGNPVKVGGKYNVTPPTLANAQRGDVQLDPRGYTRVTAPSSGALTVGVQTDTDASGVSNTVLRVAADVLLHTGSDLDRARTPSVFKPVAVTAIIAGTGATIWTPAAGKKFRVMGIAFSSSAAGQLILGDNLAATVIARSPTLAAGGIWMLGASYLGNGILSALVNNVLKIDGPTGNVAGMVWGTEE